MLSRTVCWGIVFAACTLASTLRAETGKSTGGEPIGDQVADFSLDNCYGKPVSLGDYRSKPAVAIVFLGTECPLAKLYGPRLAELQRTFGQRGLQILGINANTQDSLTELAAYAHRHQLNFPMLKDVGNKVADALGAERTPEVFLLDEKRVVRYHGRIDDQYGVGYSRERDVSPELANAIEALLSGRAIEVPQTEPVGCHIGRVKELRPTGSVTFAKHIAPILNRRCVTCHRPGEIAPFTLTSYEDVLGWEDTILEVIDDNRMPPWFADPQHGEFANDARLSSEERGLIEAWIAGGMPEGDPKDLPPAPEFSDGWQIDEPHQVIAMREEPFAVPAEGIVDYQRFVVDPGWTEDKYVVQAEARPDKRSVVHHILVYIIPKGQRRQDLEKILAGYAPGSPPTRLSDGVAIKVEAGSRLLFEMHYTPNGTAEQDRSYLGLRFAQADQVTDLLQGRVAINTRFEIPPGAANHVVQSRPYEVRQDELLLAMSPHMHLRGKSFRYDVRFPDGRSQTLLNVPNYDFNWQLKYYLKEPLLLPRGTQVICTAVFDNSQYNLTNPDPNIAVRWGDQSFEEMMIGFMDAIPVSPSGSSAASKDRAITP